MEKVEAARLRQAGQHSKGNKSYITSQNTNTQRRIVLEHLEKFGSITTLEARNELFIMGIAARIFELKERGYNIITEMVPVYFGCKRKIARYVLLDGGVNNEQA